MKIKENVHQVYENYSYEMQQQVIEIFHYASKMEKINTLLEKIKIKLPNLSQILWTEDEEKEKNQALSFFNARMQATVYYTLKNIEGYQECGWKELIYEGDKNDEKINFVKKSI